jgi:hypothetical protein
MRAPKSGRSIRTCWIPAGGYAVPYTRGECSFRLTPEGLCEAASRPKKAEVLVLEASGGKFRRSALKILPFVLFLLGLLLHFSPALRHFCCDGGAITHRWPHLTGETRDFIKYAAWVGHVLSSVVFILEVWYGPKKTTEAIRMLRGGLETRTGAMRAVLRRLTSFVRPRLKVPATRYYMLGERWWEDGPLYLVFLWLMFGRPGLSEWLMQAYTHVISRVIPSWVPFPSASAFVGVPLLVTGFAGALLALLWFCRLGRMVCLLFGGLWMAPRRGYWAWLKERIQRISEVAESDFAYPTRGQFGGGRVRLKLSGRAIAYCLLLAFLWIIWPAVVYLLLLSVALWLTCGVLFFLAHISSLGLRYGRMPRVSLAIEAFPVLIECGLELM